jgi:hypothetical protein
MPGRLMATVALGSAAEESVVAPVGVAGGETIFCTGKLDLASGGLNSRLDGRPRSTSAAGLDR